MAEVQKETKRRHIGSKKRSGKAKNRQKTTPFNEKKAKIDNKMRKLFQKRAREYTSDDDDDKDNEEPTQVVGDAPLNGEDDEFEDNSFADDEVEGHGDGGEASEDEGGEIQPGITKFTEGCRAFKMAFKKILKKTASDDVLGPVLSAHKKLVAEKLAEDDAERKVKGEAKKEKHLIGEKGHVKPANFLDAHEKLLIGVATKGVVKLFNAVNKAQHAQRGLNPSRSKDEKTIKKRKKEAFFSELGKTSSKSASIFQKGETSFGSKDKDGPAWAPLRDNYMLTNPKLKDWDKKQDMTMEDDFGVQADTDISSDDD